MDATTNGTQTGAQMVHRYDASIPASIYINGTQIPPIDAEGRITNLSSNTLRFECDNRIPIPSRGVVRFSLGGDDHSMEIPVDVISRVDKKRGIFSWGNAARFEVSLAIGSMHKETSETYQRMMTKMLFGNLNPTK